MNVHSTETLDKTSEMRLLTDAELDEVNGGFWLVLYALAAGCGVVAGFLSEGVGIGDQIAF